MTEITEPRIETNDNVEAQRIHAPVEIPIVEKPVGMNVDLKVEVYRFNPKTGGHDEPKTVFDTKCLGLDDLLTKAGRDLIHNASFMTGVQPAALTYYAVTTAAGYTPVDTNTTMASEVTTPTQMARHQPTGTIDGIVESFTHSANGNTTVVVCAFKNNAAPDLTLTGYGNFNAAAAGTLGTTSAFTAVTLKQNDILKLTVTITAG